MNSLQKSRQPRISPSPSRDIREVRTHVITFHSVPSSEMSTSRTGPSPSPSPSPSIRLDVPTVYFSRVDVPGAIRSPQRAIDALGGLDKLEQAFLQTVTFRISRSHTDGDGNGSHESPLVENAPLQLCLRPDTWNAIPLQGQVDPVQTQYVLRVSHKA